MTLKFKDNIFQYNISFNITDVTGDWTLSVKSQYSHEDLFNLPVNTVQTNARYSEFELDFDTREIWNEHVNGIYNYKLTNGTDELEGILKIVSGTGGGMNTEAYQSDNEDREAPVYFRPNY